MENTTTNQKTSNEWRIMCDTTLSNLSNMERRLQSENKFNKIILIYYNVFLILHSITVRYFSSYNSYLAEYFGLIISIVMLAYSLNIGNARYSERIANITNAIQKIKTIKRDFTEDPSNIEAHKKKYYNCIDKTEIRSETDFFRTIKQLCVSNNVKWFNPKDFSNIKCEIYCRKIPKYLSEINPYQIQVKIVFTYILKIIVVCLPVLVVICCLCANTWDCINMVNLPQH